MSVSLPMAEGPGWPEALPLLPHPAEILVGLFAFGLLLWLMTKFVVPALEKAYDERTAAIEGGMEEAKNARAEADAAKKKYEDQLASAHDEASKIREKAKEDGAVIITEMRQQAKDEAARITATAHKQVEAERQQAMVTLRSEVGEISTNLASRIVGESLQEEAQQSGVIERFLSELESTTADDAVVSSSAGSSGGDS